MKTMPITPVRPHLTFGAEEAAWKQAGFPEEKEYFQFKQWCHQNSLNQYGDESIPFIPVVAPCTVCLTSYTSTLQ